jgi:hypothetical protein
VSELCWEACPHCGTHGPHPAKQDTYDPVLVAECPECFGQWDLNESEAPNLGGSGASSDGVMPVREWSD